MLALPGAIPVTTPVASTVAMSVAPLLHTPPLAPAVNMVTDPAQTLATPGTAPAYGSGLTVTTVLAFATPQPLVTVYNMFAMPCAIPVTTPEAFTVAIAVASLLHTPPVAPAVKVITDPTQTVAAPGIAPALGSGLIVTTAVALATPQPLVTV